MSASQNSPSIRRKPLLTAMLDPSTPIERVEIKEIELAPSQETGLHRHPCTVVGYVAAGSIVFQLDGQPSRILKAGDAFHEPRNARVQRFDNASDHAPAKFIAFYFLERGDSKLIEMLD